MALRAIDAAARPVQSWARTEVRRMGGVERLRANMAEYFLAEKQESLIFLLVGALAIGASIYLLVTRHSYRGMAYPLIAVGLIQIAVGGSVYLRTDAQLAGLGEQLTAAPAAYKAAELPRMEKVATNFTIYKGIEIALLAAGIALTFAFRQREQLYGAGIGLILQASLMLVFDLVAERRADTYMALIRELPS
jgi:hypothetical protein